jgi:hypothetical protein
MAFRCGTIQDCAGPKRSVRQGDPLSRSTNGCKPFDKQTDQARGHTACTKIEGVDE